MSLGDAKTSKRASSRCELSKFTERSRCGDRAKFSDRGLPVCVSDTGTRDGRRTEPEPAAIAARA